MFQPGHLYLQPQSPYGQRFEIHLDYDLERDPQGAQQVHFDLHGEIDGQPFTESFELPRELAVNFASVASRLAGKHGLRVPSGPVMFFRDDYDAMFDDLRQRLDIKPGEPVDLQKFADLSPAQLRCPVAEAILKH
ncbi:DUF5064 family protein [Pseudomonas sp. LS44]|uniref:DUF5064 family protein n=1 Tax=Pseudomonas sp. LS44 TaxID=1357074 RepID=UPI00215AC031|nr:DUF5064 family protein [Pseudomonas sp. LS44]UVE19099.1 DUF5064 family protein [Pseudomonas sp. LS44]